MWTAAPVWRCEMLVQVAEGVGGQVGSAVVLHFKQLAGLDFGGVLR